MNDDATPNSDVDHAFIVQPKGMIVNHLCHPPRATVDVESDAVQIKYPAPLEYFGALWQCAECNAYWICSDDPLTGSGLWVRIPDEAAANYAASKGVTVTK